MADNPFDRFDAPKPVIGGIRPFTIGSPNPIKGRQERATLERTQVEAETARRTQDADVRIKNAQAEKQERDNRQAAADDAAAAMRPTGKLTIDQVPDAARPIVKALLAGNLPAGARSITSPQMLPYLQMAINIDPNFSAATFPARASATKQLADMKSTGGYLTSLAANIDHSREEEAAIERLNNPGGFYGRMGGAALHNWLYNKGGPAGAQFDQANRVYSGEQVKSIVGNVGSAGGGSALADRQDAEKAISADMPIDAQRAALRTGAIQNYQKFRDADQAFMRTMGTHIPDALSQEQAAQLLHLMRLREDGAEGEIPDNVDPAFVALAQGTSPNTGPGGGATPPGGGTGAGSGPAGGGGIPGGMTIATGKTQDIPLGHVNGIINQMVRAGKSAADIGAAIKPYGFAAPSDQEVQNARDYLAGKGKYAGQPHPNYSGSFGGVTKVADTTMLQRAAGSGAGAFVSGGLTGATGGTLPAIVGGLSFLTGNGYENGRDQAKVKQALLRDAYPGTSLIGGIVGGAAPIGGLEAGAVRLGLGKLAVPAAESLYGGVSGYNEGGIKGAVEGAVLAPIGGLVGRKVIAPIVRPITRAVGDATRSVADRFGISIPGGLPVPAPSAAASDVLAAAKKAGIPAVQQSLTEASQLGVPMALADTSAQLRSLAGAAVRRSTNAAQLAENTLIPRSRGQIDRLGNAVTRDLGPVANVPQLSADMIEHARAISGPLYDKAYSAPAIGSPEIDSLLQTPFGQQAVSRARTIAANERRDPTALGFALDDGGNVTLNPVRNDLITAHASARAELDDAQEAYKAARYTGGMDASEASDRVLAARDKLRTAESALNGAPTQGVAATGPQYTPQTLDYVKRGMDDVLEQEQNRHPLTGRLMLDEVGRAQNDVRSSLLTELDTLNPAYKDARAAYAGPAQARDALARGEDAFSLSPDELGMQVANQSPEHLAQMQLGYRSELMNRANSVRDASNPFEATLGNPNARARVETVYPDNSGTDNLFRQRDLEGQLASTNNEVLGGSPTARRTIADRAFDMAAGPALALDAGMITMGHAPVATASILAAKGAKAAIQNVWEKNAAKRADDIAPILLNTDPQASIAMLSDLASNGAAYRNYINNLASRRFAGAATAALAPSILPAQP